MTVKTIIDIISILKLSLEEGKGLKYLRLAQSLEKAIHAGTIMYGAKLPPHRILADKLGVTPGTVSRAYAELERMGLVIARVGDGTFVRERGQQSSREKGFRNFIDTQVHMNDMSRNMHIPGTESELLARTLTRFAQDRGLLQELMMYTHEGGLARHRQAGAKWLKNGNFIPVPEQVLCVNGSQHGLLSVIMAMLRAGDTLVTEQLTYPGLISISRFLGIKILSIEMDDNGIIPSSLQELCRINKITALYCTPTIQNPTTSVLSVERRREIAKICTEHNILIIEDETHGVLMFDRPPPITFFAPERGIVISSLSKAVSSGLRVGYVHVPASRVDCLSAAIRNTCWMATPLSLEIASEWIENGSAISLLNQQVEEIARRKNLVMEMLQGLHYVTHSLSPHFWIEVPAPWRISEIEHFLRQKNHLIATAEAFHAGKGPTPQFVRASVSNYPAGDDVLLEGFSTLAEALRYGINQSVRLS